jgi:hypothetical protein
MPLGALPRLGRVSPGRRIPDPGFGGDHGAPDPALTAALAVAAADPARMPEVLAALHGSRVLAPVVAVVGETATTSAGLSVDKTSDIALPVLVADDGMRAVPVFSGLATLRRWDAQARPVPVDGPRAAHVALAEGAEALLLDLAGPCPTTVGAAGLRALAGRRAPVAAYDDEALRVTLHQVLARYPEVESAWLHPWLDRDARLTVRLAADADPEVTGRRLAPEVRAATAPGVLGVDLALQSDACREPAGRRVFARRED